MKQSEIDKYRELIDLQLKEKVTEIESNVSIIIIGSLGFFLTINEKFVGIRDASQKWALVLSVLLLLASFFIYLISKYLTTKYDRELIDFLDDEMKEDDKDSNTKLLEMWSKFDTSLSKNRKAIFWTLAIGILLEIFFFMFNLLNTEPKKNNNENLNIEIIIKDSNNKYVIIQKDTTTLKNKSMTDKKKQLSDSQAKQDKQRSLNEGKESKNFSRVEKAKNSSDSGKIEYISKPKISSQDINNDKKK
ncbi:MAG: hypothetical protein A2546_03950 [Sphingobacteriia bacterium RIFOXYD2_FULL_35_12]|nr:MAG: hypothetical protein A2472_06690 [Sphingobacteriia bacterium RIFOXYC2_FULL_35_18]OHC87795.1 MAG: hypothetical protein A2546_03950 [Sphingobacteriia bacterium RIFOXYD2_FULL_35_12]